jgi:hypothetical protein
LTSQLRLKPIKTLVLLQQGFELRYDDVWGYIALFGMVVDPLGNLAEALPFLGEISSFLLVVSDVRAWLGFETRACAWLERALA